jgi:curved DNA-binding protein CbpA
MTDYFALLGEARRPFLEPEKLKEKYYALSRSAPPGAELNEAYRILSDPKLRLQHFLILAGADLSAGRPVPTAVAELFWSTGTLLRELNKWLLRKREAAGALSLALLQPERIKLTDRLDKLEAELRAAYDTTLVQLPAQVAAPNELSQLIEDYDSISYLTRLLQQIAETRYQLSVA